MKYINITLNQNAILAILDILFGAGVQQSEYKLDVALLQLFRMGLSQDLNAILNGDMQTANLLRKGNDDYHGYDSNLIKALGRRDQSVNIKGEANVILTYLLRSYQAFMFVSQQLGKIPNKDATMVKDKFAHQPVLKDQIMHNHRMRALYFVQALGLFSQKIHPAAMSYADSIHQEAITHRKNEISKRGSKDLQPYEFYTESLAPFEFPIRKPLEYLNVAPLVPDWKPVDLVRLTKDSLLRTLQPCLYTLDGRIQAMQHVLNHLEASMIKFLTDSNQVLQYGKNLSLARAGLFLLQR